VYSCCRWQMSLGGKKQLRKPVQYLSFFCCSATFWTNHVEAVGVLSLWHNMLR
jgi:hypothetical protein